ncbi:MULTISPECIES: PTS system mannose/fructose/N-acetylgalactosamine-transporter subunit IIB [Clostridium]|uniref:PTS system mannose/fructose/N-acetylgalactosamine-transporter subunit IIB n=1 Tax=Clostridium TaxID=1485 RepID=UPI0008247EFB|nr:MULTISPECIES: PTS sugar transporter subunit IIB [Clostridium]PJI09220.1 PTS mannose/fructose/sorbose transporter subunit IIB [Clostridium sp. CT7]
MLKIARLDDRLVHGLIINNWCTNENITEIMVVDKEACGNEMRKAVIHMSAPEDINVMFCTAEEAANIYKEEAEYENLMMIFGNPFELLEFLDKGGVLKSINIGGMTFKEGRKRLSTSVYATKEEVEALKKIADKKILLEVRILPTDISVDLLKYI